MIQRFGRFSIDPDRLELTEDGEPVTVEPQVFSLLAFLIENRDRVLSKDEIIEHVWQGRIVSDDTLNSRISAARRAVGDNGTDQAVIKTFPRRGFRFVAEAEGNNLKIDEAADSSSSNADEPRLALPDKPSIAVLPFDNISGDPEQEYFSDGITEDIITELSKISGLFVIARHSAFIYKGKSVSLKQVGVELGVRYILEGSVRRAGNRLRITSQLIDAGTDHHIWAERYDRDMEDIFAVQDEVARQVADALAVALRPGEGERLAHVPTRNIEAYDIYMRSRMRAWPPTIENVVAARDAYHRIIEIDPDFAGGHAGASMTYSLAVRFGHSGRPEEDATTAMTLAERAMALDDQFALSHSALGLALDVSNRFEEAVDAAQRAVNLQPGDTDGYMYLAHVLFSAGRGEEARDAVLTALRLDPQYVKGPYFNVLGRACFIAGRYEEAVEAYERNRSGGGPIAVPMLSVWVACLGLLGRIEEAHERAQELLRYVPGFTVSDAHRTFRFRNSDDLDSLIDGLRKAGLPEK